MAKRKKTRKQRTEASRKRTVAPSETNETAQKPGLVIKSIQHGTVVVRQNEVQPLTAKHFNTAAKTSNALKSLMAQCQANSAAAAIVPWFCDALPSPSSRRDYYNDMRSFFGHMSEIGVHPFEVTGDHVRLYKEALVQSQKKSGTIARHLSVIRGLYEQFGKKSLVPWQRVGDIQAVTAPRVEKNVTPEMSEDEAIAMLEPPDMSTTIGIRDHALMFVYFKTACRSAAIANAKVGDLDKTDTEWFLIVKEKGATTRRLPLLEASPALFRWLDEVGIGNDPTSPLFPSLENDRKTPTGRHMRTRTVLHTIKKYGKMIGLNVDPTGRRGICTHSLRKTSLNNALKHGAKVEQVQQWAGHADIRTTQGYISYHEQDAEAAARHNQIRPRPQKNP